VISFTCSRRTSHGERLAREARVVFSARVVAIAGNHEYYTGVSLVLDALRKAGIDVLYNDGRVIAPGDGGGFALVGVDDMHAPLFGKGPGPRPAEALAKLPPDLARIVLCHQPTWTGNAAAWGFQLMLAGIRTVVRWPRSVPWAPASNGPSSLGVITSGGAICT